MGTMSKGGVLWGISKAYNYALNGLAVCAGIVIFAAFVLIVTDVTIRTTSTITGINPPAFTISVVEYILFFFTMFSAPWLVRIKGHVFIDAITQLLPRHIQVKLAKVVYFLCVVAALTAFYVSLGLAVEAVETGIRDIRGVDMPQWLLFVPMPPCFLMVAIEFLRYLLGFDDMYGTPTELRGSV